MDDEGGHILGLTGFANDEVVAEYGIRRIARNRDNTWQYVIKTQVNGKVDAGKGWIGANR
jgi:hypothetical protein